MHQVAEQDGDDLSLLANLRPCGHERRAAVPAEPKAFGIVLPTVRTPSHVSKSLDSADQGRNAVT